jgi:chromosomal replication initiation ATPase DnaA
MTKEETIHRILEYCQAAKTSYNKGRISGYLDDFLQANKIIIRYSKIINQSGLPYLSEKELEAKCQEVGAKYDLSVKEIRKKYDKMAPKKVVDARKEFCQMIYSNYRISLTGLGRFFGGMHHCSILYYIHEHRLPHRKRVNLNADSAPEDGALAEKDTFGD